MNEQSRYTKFVERPLQEVVKYDLRFNYNSSLMSSQSLVRMSGV